MALLSTRKRDPRADARAEAATRRQYEDPPPSVETPDAPANSDERPG